LRLVLDDLILALWLALALLALAYVLTADSTRGCQHSRWGSLATPPTSGALIGWPSQGFG
jgi:hypothetical protein